jgi:glutathione S-transferase
MKLYYSPGACSLAVRIVINELNISCDYERVDLRTKKTESGVDFLDINLKGSVPTLLLDNGDVLTENGVIQQYLADQHPSPLLPNKDDFRHYRVLEWLNFVTTDLHKGFGPIFSGDVPQTLKESVFIPDLKKKFAYVDEHLANNTFLTGNEFSLADGYIFVLLTWFKSLKVDIAIWPNIFRFFNAVKTRPAVQKSLEEER